MNKLVVDFERVCGDRGRIKYSATRAAGGEWPPLDGWRRSEALLQAAIDLVGLATRSVGLPRTARFAVAPFGRAIRSGDRIHVPSALRATRRCAELNSPCWDDSPYCFLNCQGSLRSDTAADPLVVHRQRDNGVGSPMCLRLARAAPPGDAIGRWLCKSAIIS